MDIANIHEQRKKRIKRLNKKNYMVGNATLKIMILKHLFIVNIMMILM